MDENQYQQLRGNVSQLNRNQKRLADRQTRIEASDRRQWGKLQAQQRNNALFAGVIAIGVLLNVGGLTDEDKASIQQVIVAIVVAAGGAGGIIKANTLKPPEEDDNDPLTEDEDQWS